MSDEFCGNRTVTEVQPNKLDLSRRNFFTGLATFATAIGLSSLAQTAEASSKKYKVCMTKDVKVRGAAIFRVAAAGGIMVLITQPKAGTYRAFNPSCTHQGFRLSALSGTNMVCEAHGAQFDTNTGAVKRGPARSPLQKYTVSVSGTTLYINV